MKSVLISIIPKWCELIANGKKTIEVRKTRPKCDMPFKCYIYCTKEFYRKGDGYFQGKYCGKVIGEFVCKNMTCIQADIDFQGEKHLYNTAFIENRMCLNDEELFNYIYDGKRNEGWGWHISDLVIYDKPKELSKFATFCDKNVNHCANCEHYLFDNDDLNGYRRWCGVYRRKPLTRPPQSWCYVEEV